MYYDDAIVIHLHIVMYTEILKYLFLHSHIVYIHTYLYTHHITIYRLVTFIFTCNTNQSPAPPLPFNFQKQQSLWPNWYNVEASRMPRGPMRAPERYWVPISLGTPKTAKSKLSVSCVQSVKGGYLKILNPLRPESEGVRWSPKKPWWVEYWDEYHLEHFRYYSITSLNITTCFFCKIIQEYLEKSKTLQKKALTNGSLNFAYSK